MVKDTVHDLTIANRLCIGCGLCAAVCPRTAISLDWKDSCWTPAIDTDRCTHCGACSGVCPNTPARLSAEAIAAAGEKEWFGLPRSADCYISYDTDQAGRIKSASGGATTAVLKYLLEKQAVRGVITAAPVPGGMGSPHCEVRIIKTPEGLEATRSSHYHPLRYDDALRELLDTNEGPYAIVGLPCIMRGIKNLPSRLRDKIKYRFCLVCSHNTTGRFTDCLAGNEGVPVDQRFLANLRDKVGNIPDANNYNVHFRCGGREIRTNRLKSTYTPMWRGYFFAQECCLYCPDFYGADADFSVKDAWGRLSKDPAGTSLIIVRNKGLAGYLEEMKASKSLYLQECDRNEIDASQHAAALFKHAHALRRFRHKRSLARELQIQGHRYTGTENGPGREMRDYLRFRINITLSNFLYRRLGNVYPLLAVYEFLEILGRYRDRLSRILGRT